MQQQRSVEFDIGVKAPMRLAFAKKAERSGFNASGKVMQARSQLLE